MLLPVDIVLVVLWDSPKLGKRITGASECSVNKLCFTFHWSLYTFSTRLLVWATAILVTLGLKARPNKVRLSIQTLTFARNVSAL